jgi:hypothetical protein
MDKRELIKSRKGLEGVREYLLTWVGKRTHGQPMLTGLVLGCVGT